ncbi:MAG: endonuclease MutS2 [Ignavibacteriales bacterium]|nr:endonuclease MutS2 [Ignavibacteriales bacterium]
MQEFLSSFAKIEFDVVKSRVEQYLSSATAKKLLEQTFPFSSAEKVRYELAIVSEMRLAVEVEGGIPFQVTDESPYLLHKLSVEGAYLSSQELLQLHQLLKVSRETSLFFSRKKEHYPLIALRVQGLYFDKIVEYNIEQAIDENGSVKDSASRHLKNIGNRIAEISQSLRKRLETILKKVVEDGFAQDEIITTREGRMVIPIKAEHKNQVAGFIHSSSASGQTMFIEPSETLVLNNEIRSLHFEEQREIEKILRELSLQVSDHRLELLHNVDVLSYLELVEAKARYSLEIQGNAPQFIEEGTIYFENARHPLLLEKHSWKDVVPLTIEMGNDWKTLLITGPNAGGKSVTLKTIGLLLTMVQAGLHIPASSESRCKLLQKLFVDIGDEQSIENDLSTFSSHLQNLKIVIENADDESLVLLDELGSGTDPTEGSAIAASVLDFLTKRKCLTIATTHNGELKAFAQSTENIENAGMEFDQATLMPTYRLRVGIPGSSYALEIAQRMNFPEYILHEAKKYRGELPNQLEQLLNDVEKRSQFLQKEAETINYERTKISVLISSYETKLSASNKAVKEIRRKALNEAKELLDSARRTIELAVKEIRDAAAEKNVVAQQIENVAALKRVVLQKREIIEPQSEQEEKFSVGEVVKMKRGTETGEIISETKNGEEFWVSFATLKMKVHKSELQHVESKVQKKFIGQTVPVTAKEIKREIDLRGLYGDEAVALVDKFLDEAATSGLEKVNLIHGKGTGALRKRITEYLTTHPLVKSYAQAEWNEGGMGATVVELVR